MEEARSPSMATASKPWAHAGNAFIGSSCFMAFHFAADDRPPCLTSLVPSADPHLLVLRKGYCEGSGRESRFKCFECELLQM